MQTRETRWYASAVDWWLGVVLVLVPLISVAVLVAALVDDKPVWPGALGLVLLVALYAALVVPVRYGLAQDHLVVRFGLIRQRVPYSNIRRVHPTRNPLSSPALSLKRLCVDTGTGPRHAVRISPAARDEFLDGLARLAGLARRGDSLGPADSSLP